MYACISYKLVERRLKHALYMSIWVSIPNQGSMKYALYSSIEHGNVIAQQMPGIHVRHHIGHDIEFILLAYIRYFL